MELPHESSRCAVPGLHRFYRSIPSLFLCRGLRANGLLHSSGRCGPPQAQPQRLAQHFLGQACCMRKGRQGDGGFSHLVSDAGDLRRDARWRDGRGGRLGHTLQGLRPAT